MSSLLPKPLGATAMDDTSTAKQELEKCYKRIADLETRIHDLTLQTSVVSCVFKQSYLVRQLFILFCYDYSWERGEEEGEGWK